MNRYPEFVAEVGGWLRADNTRNRGEGLDRAVTAFLGLFSGDNTGKMIVRLERAIGPDPHPNPLP